MVDAPMLPRTQVSARGLRPRGHGVLGARGARGAGGRQDARPHLCGAMCPGGAAGAMLAGQGRLASCLCAVRAQKLRDRRAAECQS